MGNPVDDKRAKARLLELLREKDAILAAFPELRRPRVRHRVRHRRAGTIDTRVSTARIKALRATR
jgi:hypothetical protein